MKKTIDVLSLVGCVVNAEYKRNEEIIIEDCQNVATSFPNFTELCEQTGVNITIISE